MRPKASAGSYAVFVDHSQWSKELVFVVLVPANLSTYVPDAKRVTYDANEKVWNVFNHP